MSLIMAAQVSIVARALVEHVREAVRKGWCVPDLVAPQVQEADQSAVPAQPQRMELTGLWPFWKDALNPSTVRNDLVLDHKAVLLTGPNMAGKSTVLRSVAAVALLGCCGLLVPASRAQLPFYDAIMLRNFSGDSPLEGLSSFALECSDMRSVLRDATSRSLVLFDEMGKGTEVDAATALSAALLEDLMSRRTHVMFATHLHGLVKLLDYKVPLNQMAYMCMGLRPKTGQSSGHLSLREPTLQIIPGICYESMAMEVAQQMGVSDPVVLRALELYRGLRAASDTALRHAGSIPAASAAGQAGTVLQSQSSSDEQDCLPAAVSDVTSDASSSAVQQPQHTVEDAVSVLKKLMLQGGHPLQGSAGSDHNGDGNGSSYSNGNSSNGSTGYSTAALLSSDAQGSPGGLPVQGDAEVFFIKQRRKPPPAHHHYSAVYVVRWKTGYFYCGESDDIEGRLGTYLKNTKQNRHRGPGLEAAYILIDPDEAGKSKARLIQKQWIDGLVKEGFPMSSTGDSKLRSFGAAFASTSASTAGTVVQTQEQALTSPPTAVIDAQAHDATASSPAPSAADVTPADDCSAAPVTQRKTRSRKKAVAAADVDVAAAAVEDVLINPKPRRTRKQQQQ